MDQNQSNEISKIQEENNVFQLINKLSLEIMTRVYRIYQAIILLWKIVLFFQWLTIVCCFRFFNLLLTSIDLDNDDRMMLSKQEKSKRSNDASSMLFDIFEYI